MLGAQLVGAALWSARTLDSPKGQWLYRLVTAIGMLLLIDVWRQHRLVLWRLVPGWKWAMEGAAELGFGFCWWARLHLGRQWSATITRKEEHHVVDSGPYELVRHPIYTGIILAGFASALMRGTLDSCWAPSC